MLLHIPKQGQQREGIPETGNRSGFIIHEYQEGIQHNGTAIYITDHIKCTYEVYDRILHDEKIST